MAVQFYCNHCKRTLADYFEEGGPCPGCASIGHFGQAWDCPACQADPGPERALRTPRKVAKIKKAMAKASEKPTALPPQRRRTRTAKDKLDTVALAMTGCAWPALEEADSDSLVRLSLQVANFHKLLDAQLAKRVRKD